MITTDNKKTMKQPVIETDEYLKQDNNPEPEKIEKKQFRDFLKWRKIEWLTAFAFFSLCFFIWANEYFDTVHLLLNIPSTPFNWTDALIETLLIAIIANFVLTKLNCDITKRKQMEKSLQKAEKDWRDSFNSLEDIMMIIDKDNNIENINDNGLKLLGKSKKEVIGKKCYNIIHNIENSGEFCPLKKALKTKAVESTEQYKELFGRYFSIKCSPIFDENGEIVKCVELLRDITKRKQAEEKLRIKDFAFNSSLSADSIFNNEGFLTHANPASVRMWRYENVDEIIGKPILGFLAYKNEALKTIKSINNTGKWEGEFIALRKDGSTFIGQVSANVVYDAEGNQTAMYFSVVDVTKRKQAETEKDELHAQLLQSEKMASIGQLAAGVAHEINNPIGYIYSNLNTMNKYLWKIQKYLNTPENQDPEAKEQFDEIFADFGDAISESLEGADRVKKIVADLKSFSHADKDKSELANINKGLESTLNIVWNQLKYTCKVEKDLGDLPILYCNINQLNQVFLNILVNAGQAIIGSSGLIKIKTRADDKNIYISIKDNGVGIPQENLEKIFDPFFTTKEVGKGTGLGLNLSYEIIKKHNGKVDIKSEVGVGSEFIITLPITEAKHEHSKNSTT